MPQTLHEDTYGNMISCSDLLRMRNVLGKSFRENQKTQIMLDNLFSQHYAVYEVMWKDIVKPEEPQRMI
jgi:hypothetical protein